MNRKLLSGTFGLLATVGMVAAAGTSGAVVSGDSDTPKLQIDYGSTVPIRSGNPLDVQPSKGPRPVSIRVGDLDLEASVIPVGVDEEKQLDVPSADLVGWYQYSPTPGNAGATVLAAHVDYGGEQGAFFNLHQLEIGELFEVELEDGTVKSYEVTANSTYNKVDLPDDELFRKDGKPVLQLVTCGGTFDPEERSYEANVVVSAVPV